MIIELKEQLLHISSRLKRKTMNSLAYNKVSENQC